MDHQAAGPSSDMNWYAVWTLSRQERVAAAKLAAFSITHYLPMQSQLRQWSDRKQRVETPLFPGYLFVQLDLATSHKLDVLRTQGVVGFVGNSTGPLPIPENQIEFVRRVAVSDAQCASGPLMKEGDRVRVVRGSLAGVEGELLRFGSQFKLVIAIEMIQRSVAVTISKRDVELLGEVLAPQAETRSVDLN